MINLSEKLGEMTFDGLITDIKPAPEVRGGVIRKLSAAATLKRGTILAKSSGTAGDGKLVVLGSTAKENETLTPDLSGIEVKAFLIALSHLPGAAELAAKLPKSGDKP